MSGVNSSHGVSAALQYASNPFSSRKNFRVWIGPLKRRIVDINEVIPQAKLVVGPALKQAFAADTEAAEEFHEVGIAVGDAKTHENTKASVRAFFRFVEILIKVVVNVPRPFLLLQIPVLQNEAHPLINRIKLLVGKCRAEKL